MKSMAIILFLTFLGCCAALPVLPDSFNPIIALPVFLQEPESPEDNRRDSSSPVAYMFLSHKLAAPEEHLGGALIEKRSVKKNDELEDLETAAGNFALRPLFVYRQQMANRHRIREANTRRNRF